MAIRQTRIFANEGEPADWAETLIGRVIRPLVIEFRESLHWFWFSRYVCLIGMQGEDRGDCDFNLIPDNFKQIFQETSCKSKSGRKIEFHVADRRDQIKTQPKAFAAISVAFTQNPKDFQSANNVLNKDALAR